MADIVAGVYQLRIRLSRRVVVRVGALGRVRFAAGWYVYTGSARNGLHWHIDHLLAVADGVEAFVLPGSGEHECALHRGLRGAVTPVPGFGSSDCRCRSHLAYFRRRPPIDLTDWEAFLTGQVEAD